MTFNECLFYSLRGSLRNGCIEGLLIYELLEEKDRLLEGPPRMLKISDASNGPEDADGD